MMVGHSSHSFHSSERSRGSNQRSSRASASKRNVETKRSRYLKSISIETVNATNIAVQFPPAKIDTGAIRELNNDHVLSPDGQTIYMSNDDGHIYAVALGGGEPTRFTVAPSVDEEGLRESAFRLRFAEAQPPVPIAESL